LVPGGPRDALRCGALTRPSHSLERRGKLLHERLGVGRRGTIAGLAHFNQARPSLEIDDPFAGHPVGERHRAAGHRVRVQAHLVDGDPDAAGGGCRLAPVVGKAELFLCLVEEAFFLGGGLGRGALADVACIRLGLGILQLKVQVIDEKPDVHVGHRDLKLVRQLLLDRVEVVASGDPF